MPSQYLVTPKIPPPLNIPSSTVSVEVSVIDPGARFELPVDVLFKQKDLGGKTSLKGPTFGFLIEHGSGRKIMFDLGARPDWENYSPRIQKFVGAGGWVKERGVGIVKILEENGAKLENIEAVVWSHYHWDQYVMPSSFTGFCVSLQVEKGRMLVKVLFIPQETSIVLMKILKYWRHVTIPFFNNPDCGA
jgi:hypothetical protein